MISARITDGADLAAVMEWSAPGSGVAFSGSNLSAGQEDAIERALLPPVRWDTGDGQDILDGRPVAVSTDTAEGFELALSELYGRTGFKVDWKTAKGLSKATAAA